MQKLITQILQRIGDDPLRDGVLDTPTRVVKMYNEIFKGYRTQAPTITTFQNGKDGIFYDSMIIDTGHFFSMCEHHMLPFYGRYYFAYIPSPDGQIIGLSKVARVVDYYSSRLQIQERLTLQIVQYITNWISVDNAPPLGMALMMKGTHLCRVMRGVKNDGEMITSHLTGVFKKDEVRMEFFNLIQMTK